MAVDYDLVVVGNNAAARWAAIAAKQRLARVALVVVAPEVIPSHWLLKQWSQTMHQVAPASWGQWAQAMTMNLQSARSPAQLASLGIEQIDGVAQFSQKPRLQVQVQDRLLRSRRYLLSLDADLTTPAIPGLSPEDWLTPTDLLQHLAQPPLAQPTLVVGDGPIATILSQTLARLGHTVSLLSKNAHILPWEDVEAAFRVQTHLEADGVQIYSHCHIQEVIQQSPSPHQVITNLGTLTASALIWADEATAAMVNPNLVAINLRHSTQGLWVTPKLQTSHAQIYACGSVLGGYTLADIAQYEATVAVRNALSSLKRPVDYRTMPWSIRTLPALARVGLTESQAQKDARSFQVLYQYFKDTELGMLQDETSGWCKLIVQNDGQILGAHVVGSAAAEIVHLIAVAMQQHCPITAFAESATFGSSYGSIVGQAAQQWHRK